MEAFLALPQEELTWNSFSFVGSKTMDMDFKVVELATPFIGGSYMTRGFEEVPGLVLRVKPGGSLKFRLNNKLEAGPGESGCNGTVGLFSSPTMTCKSNSTNIHTHGLHSSPEGNEDNVFLSIAPGESMDYDIKVPEFHMGGTHWYHSHLHHSTALQAGGGAHGMIVVEDPKGSLPKMVQDMPEVPMMLSLVQPLLMMQLEQWSLTPEGESVDGQQLWINSAYPEWRRANTPDDVAARDPIWIAVNGQYRPKVSIKEGRWHRLRIAKAAPEWHTTLFLETDECEFKLLAKDGVYLNEGVRPISRIYLGSGSRADVAVRCFVPEAVRTVWKKERYMSKLMFSSWEQRLAAFLTPEDNQTGELLSFSVIPDWKCKWDEDLAPFSVRRPCYLADLRNAPEADIQRNQHTLTLTNNGPQMQLFLDGVRYIWGHETPEAALTLPVGELVEFNVTDGLHLHVFHSHVNPSQIISTDLEDPWYKVGDWHDTIFAGVADKFVIRQNLDYFTGRIVMHCHLLTHEDNGMMLYWNITGQEGTRYPAKEKLDPTCYEGSFPDKKYWGQ
mmetsp:Transcript_4336/g.10282  ORF Transcript_4336/g.10282 Transcript_4336/m.10282 type:complete len:557 (+) Transcript_4336:376-2046(+)